MTAQIIDGKVISEKLLCEIAADVEAMEKAIEVSVPKKAITLNLNAFRRGLQLS